VGFIAVALAFAASWQGSMPLGAAAAVLGVAALWNLNRSAPRPSHHPEVVLAPPVAEPESAPIPQHPRIPPTLEPEVVVRALRDAAELVAPPVAAHLWLCDPSTDTLRLVAASGPMAPTSQPLSVERDEIIGRACRERTATLGPLSRVHTYGGEIVVWRFALPLSAGDTAGVAVVDVRNVDQPSGGELARVTAPLRGALAGALALHVSRIELETAHTLIDVARDLSRILDPDTVLATALDRAMAMCGATTGSVMLLDSETGRLHIAVSRGLPEEIVRDTALGEGEGIAGWVLTTGQPLLIEDLPARTPTARRHGIRSAVSVPLSDDDGLVGVLNVGSRAFPARFTESHLHAVELIGRHTATALRNARAISVWREVYFETLKALALAMETKDPYARGGTERVLEYAEALGRRLGLEHEQSESLRIAALLHDIGMEAVGESVVSESRPLSTVERALLKMHPQIAADILGEAPTLRGVVPIVFHHHERYDGEGYGGGIGGEDIPLGARILAVADAYVAMTSDRPYRGALTQNEALRELGDKSGTQFDPAAVDALKDILGGRPERIPEDRR
jgi:hypothetical protein